MAEGPPWLLEAAVACAQRAVATQRQQTPQAARPSRVQPAWHRQRLDPPPSAALPQVDMTGKPRSAVHVPYFLSKKRYDAEQVRARCVLAWASRVAALRGVSLHSARRRRSNVCLWSPRGSPLLYHRLHGDAVAAAAPPFLRARPSTTRRARAPNPRLRAAGARAPQGKTIVSVMENPDFVKEVARRFPNREAAKLLVGDADGRPDSGAMDALALLDEEGYGGLVGRVGVLGRLVRVRVESRPRRARVSVFPSLPGDTVYCTCLHCTVCVRTPPHFFGPVSLEPVHPSAPARPWPPRDSRPRPLPAARAARARRWLT